MYIDLPMILTAISAITVIGGAIFAVFKYYTKLYKFVEEQSKQEQAIKDIKKEMTLLCYCMSATLDGLLQQGCNHTVPVAKDKLDKYLNLQAHDQE